MGAQRGVLESLSEGPWGRCPVSGLAQLSHSAGPWLTVRHKQTTAGRAGAALQGGFNLLMVCFKEEERHQGNTLATGSGASCQEFFSVLEHGLSLFIHLLQTPHFSLFISELLL